MVRVAGESWSIAGLAGWMIRMAGLVRYGLVGGLALLALAACAGNGARRSPTVEYRGAGASSVGASGAARDWVRDAAAVSSSPAVQEAAALVPETRERPGGAKRVPRGSESARRITVQRGDSLSKISGAYGVDVGSLIATNKLASPDSLEVGQVIMLPPPNIHTIERGETLFSAALRFSIDTRSLAVMNGLERPWVVYPGDELLLPPMAQDGGKVRVAAVRRAARPSAETSAAKTAQPRLAVNGPAVEDFIWPVEGKILRGFGQGADGLRNDGINIEAARGARVASAAAGEVIYVGDELEGLGMLVLVAHPGGWITAYAHADEALVRVGQMVAQGEVIAHAGASGKVSEPQVHFQLRKDGDPIDPTPMMPS